MPSAAPCPASGHQVHERFPPSRRQFSAIPLRLAAADLGNTPPPLQPACLCQPSRPPSPYYTIFPPQVGVGGAGAVCPGPAGARADGRGAAAQVHARLAAGQSAAQRSMHAASRGRAPLLSLLRAWVLLAFALAQRSHLVCLPLAASCSAPPTPSLILCGDAGMATGSSASLAIASGGYGIALSAGHQLHCAGPAP